MRIVVNDTPKGDVLYELFGRIGDMPWRENIFRGTGNMMRFTARVLSFNADTGAVRLSRPVPYNIRKDWLPVLHRYCN